MKIFMLSRTARHHKDFKNVPFLHIEIGRYCFDSCDKSWSECRCGDSKYRYKWVNTIIDWLWSHKIVGIRKTSGQYSGTIYCPYKLDTIKTCHNCKHDGGYDIDCNGLCINEKYRSMTIDEMNEDFANGLIHLCRYWEPSPHDERLK